MPLVVTNLNAHLIIIFAHISQQNMFLILRLTLKLTSGFTEHDTKVGLWLVIVF